MSCKSCAVNSLRSVKLIKSGLYEPFKICCYLIGSSACSENILCPILQTTELELYIVAVNFFKQHTFYRCCSAFVSLLFKGNAFQRCLVNRCIKCNCNFICIRTHCTAVHKCRTVGSYAGYTGCRHCHHPYWQHCNQHTYYQ